MPSTVSVVMIGATGAVGCEVVHCLCAKPELGRLTLLGRRPLEGAEDSRIQQESIDVLDPESYADLLDGHTTAICTLGVGQPSTVSKEQFLRIDKLAVLDFATACKAAGVVHFELLCSVGADSKSRSFYLRSKGELQDGLQALGFDRLSLFQPSMILTKRNRYGIVQGITLKVWPWLNGVLAGPLTKYRGIRVEQLGAAIANNTLVARQGSEVLQWADFIRLSE